MPIEGRSLAAPVDLRDLLRVGLDTDPDAVAVVAADLIEFARERVGYKAPEEVVFLDEIPVNPTG